ncbi:hypothetical protein WJX74_010273 [Apatococcus lobatus]|uniref:DUF4211 domain-containing protein n=1 Tax=Apatococcus lobatus TaxID=904363 RepID=A0AAW1QH21_9CHLO
MAPARRSITRSGARASGPAKTRPALQRSGRPCRSSADQAKEGLERRQTRAASRQRQECNPDDFSSSADEQSADNSSFINDDDDDDDECSSGEEADTSMSPAATPAASAPASAPASEPDEDVDGSFLASDEDLPHVVLPGDPVFGEGHAMTRRSSRRRSSQLEKPLQRKNSSSSTHSKKAAVNRRAERRAVRDAQLPNDHAARGLQPQSQPSYSFEQLGLVACRTCKNISHGAPSCDCNVAPGAATAAQQALKQQAPRNSTWADHAAGEEDDTLPLSALAQADIDQRSSAAPSAGEPLRVNSAAVQLPPSATMQQCSVDLAAQTDLPAAGSSDDDDDDDDIVAPARQNKKDAAARRASLVLDEEGNLEDDVPGQPGPERGDAILEDKTAAFAQASRGRRSSSLGEASPVDRQHASKAGLLSNPMIEDAALDNDIEFPFGIVPAPSSRKRKRLRHAPSTISGDSLHQNSKDSKEHGVMSPGRCHSGARQQQSQEVGPSSTGRGGRARASRAAKQRSSSSAPQLQDQIKQHQQRLLDGSGDALHGGASSEDDDDEDNGDHRSTPEEGASQAEDLDSEDDLEGFIDYDEDAAPAEGVEPDEEEELEETAKPSSSTHSSKRAQVFRDPAKIVSSGMKARYSDEVAFDIWIELLLNQLAVPGYLEAAEDQDSELHSQYIVCASKVEDHLLFLRDNCMTSAAWSRATPHFLEVINLLPGMDTEDYQFDLMNTLGGAASDDEDCSNVHSRGLVDGICDACRRSNNPASMRATFFGRPYDLPWLARSWRPATLNTQLLQDPEAEEEEAEQAHQEIPFALGRYCGGRVQLFHAATHFKHRLLGYLRHRMRLTKSRLRVAGKGCTWPEVVTELSIKHGNETINAFTKDLFNKYWGLANALKEYGTKESTGSWMRNGDELNSMIAELMADLFARWPEEEPDLEYEDPDLESEGLEAGGEGGASLPAASRGKKTSDAPPAQTRRRLVLEDSDSDAEDRPSAPQVPWAAHPQVTSIGPQPVSATAGRPQQHSCTSCLRSGPGDDIIMLDDPPSATHPGADQSMPSSSMPHNDPVHNAADSSAQAQPAVTRHPTAAPAEDAATQQVPHIRDPRSRVQTAPRASLEAEVQSSPGWINIFGKAPEIAS